MPRLLWQRSDATLRGVAHRLSLLGAAARMARWLLPWVDETRAPSGVQCTEMVDRDDGGRHATRIYAPKRRRWLGAYVVAHGFSAKGPMDPRLDRLARIFAHAGFLVAVPELRAYEEMRLCSSVARDLEKGIECIFDAVRGPRPERESSVLPSVGLFSVSFGSLAALRVAATSVWKRNVNALVLFGGCLDFVRCARFAIGGRATEQTHLRVDPCCAPAVACNVARGLTTNDADRIAAENGWRQFLKQNSGDETTSSDVMRERAFAEARRMGPTARDVFLAGCALGPEGTGPLMRAIAVAQFDCLDLSLLRDEIHCPVYLLHGVNDCVVPYTESVAISDWLRGVTRVRLYISGWLSHTRQRHAGALPHRLAGAFRASLGESLTLVGMVWACVLGGATALGGAPLRGRLTPRS
jgi:pimeloyl-ACP methyl ester carboxylesterase